MIRAENVVKTFDSVRALDGMTFHVPQGSVYGLVGPNGAGKSTIIRHLIGAYKQDSGTITIGGENVFENPSVKGRIFHISDDIYNFLQASTRDMMKFYKGFYSKLDTDRFEKLGQLFQFSDKVAIRKLSKGMQKQAAFWIAACIHPDILILDEPVDGLDPIMRRQVWSIMMNEVTENGTTVLVSSHNLRELEDVCDNVGIMNSGKVILERSLSELQENIVKVQVVFNDGQECPEDLNILHRSKTGKISTLIIRGGAEEINSKITAMQPLFFDMVPLTLEEIFVYELGGEGYAVKNILL